MQEASISIEPAKTAAPAQMGHTDSKAQKLTDKDGVTFIDKLKGEASESERFAKTADNTLDCDPHIAPHTPRGVFTAKKSKIEDSDILPHIVKSEYDKTDGLLQNTDNGFLDNGAQKLSIKNDDSQKSRVKRVAKHDKKNDLSVRKLDKKPDTPAYKATSKAESDNRLQNAHWERITEAENALIEEKKANDDVEDDLKQFTDDAAQLHVSEFATVVSEPKKQRAENASLERKNGVRSKTSIKIGNTDMSITDLRSEAAAQKTFEAIESEKHDFTVSVKYAGRGDAEMAMNVTNQIQQNILSLNDQGAASTGSNFQAMLSNQIQENAFEMARAGSIVLRDNNKGSINLVLHPESLGNVKINLQLTDKIIAGQIIVSSKEAFNAFQENLNNLKSAFVQNGFETASFDLSWTGQGGGFASNGNEQNGQRRHFDEYRSNAVYGEYTYNDNAEKQYDAGGYSVNIVA